MAGGTSTGILDKNNSKKKKTPPKQQGRSASGNRPTLTAPSTAGLGILGKDPEDVKPPMLREKAQMQGPLGMNQIPEEALASVALQRRTAQQNIVPAGGMAPVEEVTSKFQKKRQQRQKPSAISAV